MSDNHAIDNVIDLLAFAISSEDVREDKKTVSRRVNKKWSVDHAPLMQIPGMRDMAPSRCYSFDLTDKDRIFSTSTSCLPSTPQEIIGDKNEVMVMDYSSMLFKWSGIRVARRIPKNVGILGKADAVYEVHFRKVSIDGTGEYSKSIIAVDKHGKCLPVSIGGALQRQKDDDFFIAMCSGIIDDAKRSRSMLAKISDGISVYMPVPLDDYQEVFSSREGPLSFRGRKKPILHWVSRHIRKSSLGGEHNVRKHVRGIDNFELEGLRISITPND